MPQEIVVVDSAPGSVDITDSPVLVPVNETDQTIQLNAGPTVPVTERIEQTQVSNPTITVPVESESVGVTEVGIQGPPGPQGIPGPAGADVVTLTNNDAFPQTLGQVVYLSGASGVKLALADDPSTSNAIALVAQASIASLTTGSYQTGGVLSGLSGLASNVVYYLSDTVAGALTATPPSTVGREVVEMGVAISPNALLIRPRLLLIL